MKHKRLAFIIALAAAFILPTVAFAEESEHYSIDGYNPGKVRNSSDEIVDNEAHCADYKVQTPFASYGYIFTKIKLSELGAYSKIENHTANVGQTYVHSFSANVKKRILKIVMTDNSTLIEKAQQLNTDTTIRSYAYSNPTRRSAFIEQNIDTFIEEAHEKGYDYDSSNGTTALDFAQDLYLNHDQDYHEIFNSTFDTVWAERLHDTNRIKQYLIWLLQHDDDLDDFLNDDATTGAAKDYYGYLENAMLGSHTEDPINNPYSLYNVYVKPMADYIDSLPDYFEQGYDAWFYVTDNQTVQNMVGSAFRAFVPNEQNDNPDATTGDEQPDAPSAEEDPKEIPQNPNTFDAQKLIITIALAAGVIAVICTPKLLRRR